MKPRLPLRRFPASRRDELHGLSAHRLRDVKMYDVQRRRFLSEHPYCQLWLHEHGIAEELAIRGQGSVRLRGPESPLVPVPLATEVHHKNKRRAGMLLDTRYWMAVSSEAHRKIESNKGWARAAGYLSEF